MAGIALIVISVALLVTWIVWFLVTEIEARLGLRLLTMKFELENRIDGGPCQYVFGPMVKLKQRNPRPGFPQSRKKKS